MVFRPKIGTTLDVHNFCYMRPFQAHDQSNRSNGRRAHFRQFGLWKDSVIRPLFGILNDVRYSGLSNGGCGSLGHESDFLHVILGANLLINILYVPCNVSGKSDMVGPN